MWLGEYVVLDGAPALVAAVDRRAQCTITPHDDPTDRSLILQSSLSDAQWTLRGQQGDVHAPIDPVFHLIHAVQQTLEAASIALPTRGYTLCFDSSALAHEQKLGIGSSAAIAALAAVALTEPTHWASDDKTALFRLTQRAHQQFQGGVGSGSDVAAACMGGILRTQKGCDPQPMPPTSLHTLILYTGQAANTSDFIRAVQAKKDRSEVRRALQHMTDATYVGVEAMEQNDTSRFLDAVRAFHRNEFKLTVASGVPIVTDDIAEIVESMEACGGAAKASGAGGGDIVIAFFADLDSKIRAADAARAADFQVLPIAVESRGVLA